MKKNIFVILQFFCFTLIFSQTFIDKTLFDTYYYAIDNDINIRLEPTVQSKSLGKLSYYDEIIVNQDKSNDNWLFCYIPKYDCIGYCFSSFFKYKPSFNEIIDLLLKNDKETIALIELGKIKSVCLDIVIKDQLKTLDEESCLKVIKYAYLAGCNYSSEEDTVLIEAVKLNYFSVVEYLLMFPEFKQEINIKKNQFAPPLFWALWNGNIQVSEILLKNGANPNYITVYGTKAFENISEFVDMNRITKEKEDKLKKLLIQYSYVD